jgi:DNA invertase Pin-like site-specific DNA recombinase
MAVVAYLRVSTEKQFLENQREEIVRFAERNGMSIDKWYTETVSGSVSSKERKLSGVLDKITDFLNSIQAKGMLETVKGIL